MQDHRVSPFTVRLAAFCSTPATTGRRNQQLERSQQHFVASKDLDKIISRWEWRWPRSAVRV
jgi:hypothetical protein